jgi:hypothetical protein
MASSRHIVAPVTSGPPPAATLATPCSLNALRAWLKNVDVIASGGDDAVTISVSGSNITAL